MGRVGRTFVAGFDAVVMASAAYVQTDGTVSLSPAGIVLWGSAVAAALCALVVRYRTDRVGDIRRTTTLSLAPGEPCTRVFLGREP